MSSGDVRHWKRIWTRELFNSVRRTLHAPKQIQYLNIWLCVHFRTVSCRTLSTYFHFNVLIHLYAANGNVILVQLNCCDGPMATTLWLWSHDFSKVKCDGGLFCLPIIRMNSVHYVTYVWKRKLFFSLSSSVEKCTDGRERHRRRQINVHIKQFKPETDSNAMNFSIESDVNK